MINAAIVGLGWWGQHIIRRMAVSEVMRIATAVETNAERAAFAAEHGVALASDLSDVFNDPDIAAVILATPHAAHAQQVLAAARAGKHVFCEKPLALNRADAERSVEACRNAGVMLGIGNERRYEAAIGELRRLVQAGALGTIMHAEANFSHDKLADVPEGDWRASPNDAPAAGMTAMGVHLSDLYLDLFGPMTEVFAATASRVAYRQTGDVISVLMRFQSGATGYINAILVTPLYIGLTVFGSEAWVEIRNHTPQIRAARRRSRFSIAMDGASTRGATRSGRDSRPSPARSRAARPIPSRMRRRSAMSPCSRRSAGRLPPTRRSRSPPVSAALQHRIPMPRLTDIDPHTLSADQRRVYDAILSGPRGIVQGPLRMWVNSPGLADKAQALGAFCRYGTSLEQRLSELAIITTGAHWQAGFEWAVHAPIALQAGLDPAAVEAIRVGQEPKLEKPDERAVYAFASELLRNRRVSDATYRQAVDALGQIGVVDLVGVLGYYGLISMTINAFEVPLPEGAPDPFAAS